MYCPTPFRGLANRFFGSRRRVCGSLRCTSSSFDFLECSDSFEDSSERSDSSVNSESGELLVRAIQSISTFNTKFLHQIQHVPVRNFREIGCQVHRRPHYQADHHSGRSQPEIAHRRHIEFGFVSRLAVQAIHTAEVMGLQKNLRLLIEHPRYESALVNAARIQLTTAEAS